MPNFEKPSVGESKPIVPPTKEKNEKKSLAGEKTTYDLDPAFHMRPRKEGKETEADRIQKLNLLMRDIDIIIDRCTENLRTGGQGTESGSVVASIIQKLESVKEKTLKLSKIVRIEAVRGNLGLQDIAFLLRSKEDESDDYSYGNNEENFRLINERLHYSDELDGLIEGLDEMIAEKKIEN